MANEFDIIGTPNESALSEISQEMRALGPKRVEGKEFKAEQFDPLVVSKLLERQGTSHPTFATMAKVQVVSKRGQEDCMGDGSCGCQ